jgi:hypothetical protein
MTENGWNDDLDVVAMKNVVCLLAVRFEISIGDEASHVCSFSSFLTDDMLDHIFQLSSAGHALWQFTIRQGIKVDVSCVSLSALIFIFKRFFFPFSFSYYLFPAIAIFWLWQHVDNAGISLPCTAETMPHASLKADYVSVFRYACCCCCCCQYGDEQSCRAFVSFPRLCFGISLSFSPCNTHKRIWLVDYEDDTNRSWL